MTGEGTGPTMERGIPVFEFSRETLLTRARVIWTVPVLGPRRHHHAQDANASSTPSRISPFGGGGTPEGVLGEDS